MSKLLYNFGKDMATLKSYRTADSSKKITTYVYDNASQLVAFDFGSHEIPLNDVKRLDYIIITHEHSDHFMGLYNMPYVEAFSKIAMIKSLVTLEA